MTEHRYGPQRPKRVWRGPLIQGRGVQAYSFSLGFPLTVPHPELFKGLRKREDPEWAEPSEPYVLGDLTIDYAERRVTLAGRAVQLTAIEYGLLFELSANAGRVMTYDRLLQWVWGLRTSGDSRRVRTAAKQLRRKLGDDANNPTYILNEPRVGYRMPKGKGRER